MISSLVMLPLCSSRLVHEHMAVNKQYFNLFLDVDNFYINIIYIFIASCIYDHHEKLHWFD